MLFQMIYNTCRFLDIEFLVTVTQGKNGTRFGACPETLNWTQKIANLFFQLFKH